MIPKYKMVFADFDGTTTNSHREVTAVTRDWIKKYRDAGGIFVVNTGRSYLSTIPQLNAIFGDRANDSPIGCLQGGTVFSHSGELIYRISLDARELAMLIDDAERIDIYFQMYADGKLYTEKRTSQSDTYEQFTTTSHEFVGKMSTFIKTFSRPVDKLLMVSDIEKVAELFAKYTADNRFTETQFVYSTPFFLEAIPKNSGKDVAVRRIAEMYGVDLSDVAAIGDSNNDIPMILCAGHGVAMGNGVKELKAVADEITADCDHDGLAKFLQSIL